MIRTIIVDDEIVLLEDIKNMIEKNKNIEVVGGYTDPKEALEKLNLVKPDCAFLDIEMPGLDGIELAERICSINPDIEVIFVTAYNHYASQAFEVNAIDYMLKPIRPQRLEKAIEKIERKIKNVKVKEKKECTINCFGSFEVLVGDSSVKWSRSKSKEFLAYMLQNEGKWVSKYKLCDEQWSEYKPEQALAYLQTSVYRLRKSLKEIGCTQIEIEYSNNRYILRTRDLEWDLKNFDQQYEKFINEGMKDAAKKALQLYKGEYLEGEDWLWADIVREHYICKYEKLINSVE